MTASTLPEPEPEFSAEQVAKAFHRSKRWLTDRMKREAAAGNPVEHTRHGNKVTFTDAQFKAFQDRDRVVTLPQPVTTGPAKSR